MVTSKRAGASRSKRREAAGLTRSSARSPNDAGADPGAMARVEAILEKLRQDGVSCAKIGGFDIDGVLRGKYVSLDKLASALRGGFGFCDVIFGWDCVDALYDRATLTGPHTGFPDAHAVLDPSTLRHIPWEPGVVAMLCDFRNAEGEAHPACPRSLLRQVLGRAERMGLETKLSVEYEFFFFQETRETLAEKGFANLRPLDPGMFGYSWVRSGQDSELMRDILDGMADFDIAIEGLHAETGPGVYEAALRYDTGLRAADKAALFKAALKQIAHRRGLTVSFMAKWNAELPGCSGHLHQSLWKDGKNVFHDPRDPTGMSATLRHYIAGQLRVMQELTALFSPTINSYKRYIPGFWAPLVASWGLENRNCAVRLIAPHDPGAARVEYRQTAADINPYLALAAALAGGLYGIEEQLPLPPPTQGDPPLESPARLPRTLEEATERLDRGSLGRELLGAAFIDHYVQTRRWEVSRFHRAVTDWELRRYFEVI